MRSLLLILFVFSLRLLRADIDALNGRVLGTDIDALNGRVLGTDIDAVGDRVLALPDGGGEPTEYGNLDTPYISTTFHDTSNSSGYAIAYKVPLGSSLTGTLTEIRSYCSKIDDGARENVWTVYSHNADDDRPNACLSSTGRFSNGPTLKTDYAKSVSTPIVAESILWIVVFSEKVSTLSTDPRHYYTAATGGRTLTVDLASVEWNVDSEVDSLWTDLANYASANEETWKMGMRITIE